MAKVELVPFGKYRGQPVDSLASDKTYCDWLMGQDWFRDRYTAIHTLIVNNFGEPTETPEHNALQALFTDEQFVRRFIAYWCHESAAVFPRPAIVQPDAKWRRRVTFEDRGADVQITAHTRDQYLEMRIECKPTISDDYPAVLRQMRVNECNTLLIGAGGYTGSGATEEQMRAIFKSAHMLTVYLAKIEQV